MNVRNAERRDARPPRQLVDGAATKACKGSCGRTLPIDQFSWKNKLKPAEGRRHHCNDCKRESKRENYQAHADERRAKSRAYYAEHSEAVSARVRRSIAKNPEKYRAIHSRWEKQNTGPVNASTHNRRARLKGKPGKWTAAEWRTVVALFHGHCLRCWRTDLVLTRDHVNPAGPNSIDNLQPLCKSCNSIKHTRVLDLRPAALERLVTEAAVQ